jgi:diguanylate cyclase (GGDEF)-like protein/PAS domain S-box-containing protein
MNIGRYIQSYLLLLIPLSAFTGLLFWILHIQAENNIKDELKLESNILINQLTNQLSMAFLEIHSDLKLLTEQYMLHRFDNTQNSAKVIKDLQQHWSSMAMQRGRYDQIRFLDAQGQEIIRINYNNGNPYAVKQDILQSKKHRYYFNEALNTPSGKIWSSYLDLNIERRQIELPLKPTIRFATRVESANGEIIGVVIINYLAKELLDKFRRISAGFSGNAMLLNWQGYSLLSADASQDWGFMFPDSPQSGIDVRHDQAWHTIQQQSRGQLVNQQGLYTFDYIAPSNSTKNLPNCKSCLRILLHIPNKLIEVKLERQVSHTMPMLMLSFSLLALLLGMALWQKVKRQTNEQHIKMLNHKISYEHELFLSSPGVIAKLRNEVGWPIEFISANAEDLLGYKPEYFQSGNITYSSIIDSNYLDKYTQETLKADQDRAITFNRSPYRVFDSSNNHKWVQETSHVIRNKYGRLTHFFVHINDVTPLKEAEERLTQSRDYIQKVVDTIPDPTLVINLDSYELELINQSALDLYNQGRQIISGTTCYRLSHKRNTPCKGNLDPCPIQEIKQKKRTVSVIHKHFDFDGNVIHVDVRATPIFDESGKNIVQIIESHRDITETVEMERKLQHIAETDRLTQIFNRMKFDEELKNQIAWASLTHNRFGLIMLDLDHFKQVNDTFGHDVGDQVLKNTVDLLHSIIRKSDILARWGGEEFMIIAPLINADELKTLAESLRSAIEQYCHEKVGKVTASFGASLVNPSDNIDSLLKRVDSALYESKQKGRNYCTLF